MQTPAIDEALKPLFDYWFSTVKETLKEELMEELLEERQAKEQQTSYNQKETAKKLGVSVTTFRTWRTMGMPESRDPSGGLAFDLEEVTEWRKNNQTKGGKQ